MPSQRPPKRSLESSPPKLADRFLAWFCKSELLEEILGDLHAHYERRIDRGNRLIANISYWIQVLNFLRPFALKTTQSKRMNYVTLFGHYFKISWRNLIGQKVFTSINILGLAIGMSLNILIIALISQLMQFDEFHVHKDNIFRLLTVVEDKEGKRTYASTFPNSFKELSENYSGLKNVVRVNNNLKIHILHHENEIAVRGAYTDQSFFNTFSFPLAAGNRSTALSEPNSLVISHELAEKLFPNEDPIDHVLSTKNNKSYKITGVLAPHPKQTHLAFEALVSHSTLDEVGREGQHWSKYKSTYVYLHFEEGNDPSSFQSSLHTLASKANQDTEGIKYSFELQGLPDITPGANVSNDPVRFDWLTAIFLFCLGLLILIPACFNYANLMIARATKRAKEIGIRKVLGSHKRQIMNQFVIEALILSCMALMISVLILRIIRVEFLNMIEASYMLDLSLSGGMVGMFLLFGLIVGLIVGVFPAIYFSKISILHALKGQVQNKSLSISGIRKGLMVVQFTVSLCFIIGVGVIIKQYYEIITYNKGFDHKNMLVVPLKGVDHQLLTQAYALMPEVSAICLTSHLPGISAGADGKVYKTEKMDTLAVKQVFVDENFISVMGLEARWRDRLDRYERMEEAFLVNEKFMEQTRMANVSDDTLHFEIDGNRGKVAGVLKDFNFTPLYDEISPVIFRYAPKKTAYAILNIQSKDLLSSVELLKSKWEALNHKVPFESFFLDDRIEEAYDSLVIAVKIFTFLGIISIGVSVIGLLGMVSFLTEHRTKEIAIRKILGASLISLYSIIGGSFVKLLFAAIAISVPVSYFFYDRIMLPHLSPYTEGVGWLEMAISVLLVLMIGIVPILWMVQKLSFLNPSDNLRDE